MQPRRAIRAGRGAGIELFSDRGNHCGAICTLTEFGSQASYRRNMRDITPGLRHDSLNSQRCHCSQKTSWAFGQELPNWLIFIGSERSRGRCASSCRPPRQAPRRSDRSRRSDFLTSRPCNNRRHGREVEHRRRRARDPHRDALAEQDDRRVRRRWHFDIPLANDAAAGSRGTVPHRRVRLFRRVVDRSRLRRRDLPSVRARPPRNSTAIHPRPRGNRAHAHARSLVRSAPPAEGARARGLPATQATSLTGRCLRRWAGSLVSVTTGGNAWL